jgi:hypothetical protein
VARRLARQPEAPAPIGDNSQAVEEANRVQLISIVSKLSTADEAIEAARGPLQAAQKARKSVIGLGKAAGFTAKELEARLSEMRLPTREMAEIAQREHKHRRWLGILDDEQAELILGDSAPQEAKDEAHWAGEGLKAGLRQLSPNPPTECPERFVQAYMHAHERGLKEVLTANAPKQMPVREQAAADFKADNPDAPEPGSPEAKKAEREALRRAKESLAAMTPVDDGFELSPEELAAQAGRPSNEEEVV